MIVLLSTVPPIGLMLGVLAIAIAPKHRPAPRAIRIDGRHLRNLKGTIEHDCLPSAYLGCNALGYFR